MSDSVNIAVVGATGAVGREFISLFEARNLSIKTLRLFASPRSKGKEVIFRDIPHFIETIDKGSFVNIDFALFSAGSEQSRKYVPQAVEEGAIVVDNSSAFRMDSGTPLVVPEINIDAITQDDRVVANPNCCAIILLMAVAPLRSLGKIKRIVVSTYQSASGAGAEAMEELWVQTGDVVAGKEPVAKVFPHLYAFNLFSHNTSIGENGYNEEENKVIEETRKILNDAEILVNPTCVRVPVLRAHSESITIEFEGDAPSENAVREVLAAFPGVKVVDDRENNVFPMPLDASGGDDVLVGRIRKDVSNPNAISLFVSGDQLRKGAALNAVQIVEG